MRIPTIRYWQKHHTRELKVGDISVPEIKGTFYVKGKGKTQESIGVYRYGRKIIYCAWGFRHDKHCRFHAVKKENGKWTTPHEGCPGAEIIKHQNRVVGLKISTLNYKRNLFF